MRMVREFPNMAVSIMQELAHRVESTNNQLSAALAEVKQLRETAGIAALVAAILHGASIVRVHDVRPAVEAARIADAILAAR